MDKLFMASLFLLTISCVSTVPSGVESNLRNEVQIEAKRLAYSNFEHNDYAEA